MITLRSPAFEQLQGEKSLYLIYCFCLRTRGLQRLVCLDPAWLEYYLSVSASGSSTPVKLPKTMLNFNAQDSVWTLSGVSFAMWPWRPHFPSVFSKPRVWFSVLKWHYHHLSISDLGDLQFLPLVTFPLPLLYLQAMISKELLSGRLILQFFLHPVPLLPRTALVPLYHLVINLWIIWWTAVFYFSFYSIVLLLCTHLVI